MPANPPSNSFRCSPRECSEVASARNSSWLSVPGGSRGRLAASQLAGSQAEHGDLLLGDLGVHGRILQRLFHALLCSSQIPIAVATRSRWSCGVPNWVRS